MLINDLTYYINKFSVHNNYHSKTAGSDHPEKSACTTEEWRNYPIQDFDYQFNSWGFRGPEYNEHIGNPVNLCLGDSFTVNLGGPIDHSWPSILAEHFDIPTLNLGVDTAGNDAIRLVYDRACKLFDVQDTFVMHGSGSKLFNRRLVNGKFTRKEHEDEVNFEYFLKHRISNAYECALQGVMWSEVERLLLTELNIYCYKDKFLYMNYREQVDLNRKELVNKEWFNNFRGDNWPTYKQFISGDDPHPDMLTEEFGTFINNDTILYTNRDGRHLNRKYNKIYAEYLYNQWEINNES